MLSLIPIFLFLLTMVRFTPVTMSGVMAAVFPVFPSSVAPMIRSIVSQVYFPSGTIVPFTACCSALVSGERRSFCHIWIELHLSKHRDEKLLSLSRKSVCCVYFYLFLVAIMLSLVLSVFGNSISVVVYEHAPLISKAIHKIIHLRIYFTLPLLTFFWDLVYKYLPNRGAEGKTTLRKQLPGAFFTACGWMVLSFIFSVYLDIFKGFTNMYGSFTTIILVMLWLYTCMYIILLGGEINAIFRRR